MTRETRKLDGEAKEAEEHDGKSLGRDLTQSQSKREGPGKTGEAGTEKERNGCGKSGKRRAAPCTEHEGYEVSPLWRQKGEIRNRLGSRAEARDFY